MANTKAMTDAMKVLTLQSNQMKINHAAAATRYITLSGATSNATVEVGSGPSDSERMKRLEAIVQILVENAPPEVRMAVDVLAE